MTYADVMVYVRSRWGAAGRARSFRLEGPPAHRVCRLGRREEGRTVWLAEGRTWAEAIAAHKRREEFR